MNETQVNEEVKEIVTEQPKITQKEKFEEALKFNPTPVLRKKGSNEYLPWASAFAEFKKVYPRGNFDCVKNDKDGYIFEEKLNGEVIGYFVKVIVTDGEPVPLTHELSLPIMDFKNKANMNFTVMEVNKALLRCLTKCIALFGIGLTTYAGDEYYMYEIGAELEDLRDEIVSLGTSLTKEYKADRDEVIKLMGYGGKVAQIKTVEEATTRRDSMLKKLEELKLKTTKKTTKKEEK